GLRQCLLEDGGVLARAEGADDPVVASGSCGRHHFKRMCEHGACDAGGVGGLAGEDFSVHCCCVRLLACEVPLGHRCVLGPSESIGEVVEHRIVVVVDVTNVDDRGVI